MYFQIAQPTFLLCLMRGLALVVDAPGVSAYSSALGPNSTARPPPLDIDGLRQEVETKAGVLCHQISVRMNGRVTDKPAGSALSDCVTRSA